MKKKKIIKKMETLKSENKKWQEKIEDMEKKDIRCVCASR